MRYLQNKKWALLGFKHVHASFIIKHTCWVRLHFLERFSKNVHLYMKTYSGRGAHLKEVVVLRHTWAVLSTASSGFGFSWHLGCLPCVQQQRNLPSRFLNWLGLGQNCWAYLFSCTFNVSFLFHKL